MKGSDISIGDFLFNNGSVVSVQKTWRNPVASDYRVITVWDAKQERERSIDIYDDEEVLVATPEQMNSISRRQDA